MDLVGVFLDYLCFVDELCRGGVFFVGLGSANKAFTALTGSAKSALTPFGLLEELAPKPLSLRGTSISIGLKSE